MVIAYEAPMTNSLRRVVRSGVSKVLWIGDRCSLKREGNGQGWQVGSLGRI